MMFAYVGSHTDPDEHLLLVSNHPSGLLANMESRFDCGSPVCMVFSPTKADAIQ